MFSTLQIGDSVLMLTRKGEISGIVTKIPSKVHGWYGRTWIHVNGKEYHYRDVSSVLVIPNRKPSK